MSGPRDGKRIAASLDERFVDYARTGSRGGEIPPPTPAERRIVAEHASQDDPAVPPYEPPYTGDEPLGMCPLHGDYWTEDCARCGR